MTRLPSIAYFITHHGFGHATRAAAVMAALERILPQVRFELFTTCPSRLFSDSIQNDFGYVEVRTDVGVVQRSPLEEDYEATQRKLARWMPFAPERMETIKAHLVQSNCRLAICDISALGIAAAKATGLPSVLIENFTWDFLYEPFYQQVPALQGFARQLSAIYAQADLRIQTEPLCRPVEGSVHIAPISRRPRTDPKEIRAQLKVPPEAKMVVVSMGGVPDRFQFLHHLPATIDPYIVVPSANGMSSPHPKVILLPTHSQFFHPDLLQAADLLIGKAGYSTIAEAYHTGVPFGYIARPQSPESPALERFIQSHLSAHPITTQAYIEGRWLDRLPELLQMPRSRPAQENGADTVARLLCEKFL